MTLCDGRHRVIGFREVSAAVEVVPISSQT
jgi:hypothetical protein